MRLIPFVVLLLALGACDRPFVDVRVPDIEVLSPDTSIVQRSPNQTLRLRASSFRQVSQLLIDGSPIPRADADTWETPIKLGLGMNRFVLTALDEQDVPAVDTLKLLYLPYRYESGRGQWEEATGGHSVVLQADATFLIAGGARIAQGPANGRLFRFDPQSETVVDVGRELVSGRAGHTMTAVGDGSYIVAGGSRNGIPTSVDDLIEVVERYDPESGSRRLTLVGDPIRRAYHTATVWRSANGPVLELLGGLGDVRYRPDSRFGVREDLRRFLLRGDTLEAITPAPGIFIDRLAGHVQVDLDRAAPGTASRFLVAGSVFDPMFSHRFAYTLDARDPTQIIFREVRLPTAARYGAAGSLLAPGQVLRVGGNAGVDGAPQASADLFVEELGRFLNLPEFEQPVQQATLHGSATFLRRNRILLLGGFTAAGTARSSVAFFVLDQ